AVDLCLLWATEMENLLRAVCEGTGLSREQIAVSFSHTHAAGLMGLERRTLPGGELIPPYLDALGAKLAAIVRDARAAVRPAAVVEGGGRCAVGARVVFGEEAARNFVGGFTREVPADDTLLVAHITALNGAPIACIVNYACHPTTLAWENTLISPDFPGAMRE